MNNQPITMHLTDNEAKVMFAALTTYSGGINNCNGLQLRAKLVASIREDLRQRLLWCLHQSEIDEQALQREADRHDTII